MWARQPFGVASGRAGARQVPVACGGPRTSRIVVQPLDGVLVVAIEQAVSAPYCTRQLADLGARVIKVEPAAGDFARHYDESVLGTSAHFAWANRGKQSVVLDLKAPDDAAALDRILADADAFVQNLAPGAAQRVGFDARSAQARHSQLVAVDISGYGAGGPRAAGRAYDLLIQAEAGACSITGSQADPAKPGVPVADIGTGAAAASAILAGLLARGRTGRGTAISIGMFDVVTDWMGWALLQVRGAGSDLPRVGMASPMVAPYGAYPTRDGQTIVFGTTNNAEWQRLAARVLGRPDLAADPRYADNADRVRHRAELDALIGTWTRDRSFAEAVEAADGARLGWARYNTTLEVLNHPQLAERGRWVPTGSPGGDFLGLRPAADADNWKWTPGPVPGIGEHTAAILQEFSASATE
jgi:itaconate CoA-transferase